MTTCLLRCGYNFFVCCLRFSYADVFFYSQVKQKIILRHIGYDVHHLRKWKISYIDASYLDRTTVCFPKGSNQTGNSRLTRSRRSNDRSNSIRYCIKTDIVQYFYISIAETNIFQGNMMIFKLHMTTWAVQFCCIQKYRYLLHSRIYHSKTVCILQCLNQRIHKPQRQNNTRYKSWCCNASAQI